MLFVDCEASRSGLTNSCCLLKVNNEIVIQYTQDKVAAAVKKAREETKECISLNISIPSVQHVTRYQFESTEDMTLEVVKRVIESPYVYTLPAQVCIIMFIIHVLLLQLAI